MENKLSHCRSVEMFFSLGVTLTRNVYTVRMLIMRSKRKRGKEEAYMLGELRNMVRSVCTRRFFPSAESSCAQSKLFTVEGSKKKKEMWPRLPSTNHFLRVRNRFGHSGAQFLNTALCKTCSAECLNSVPHSFSAREREREREMGGVISMKYSLEDGHQSPKSTPRGWTRCYYHPPTMLLMPSLFLVNLPNEGSG